MSKEDSKSLGKSKGENLDDSEFYAEEEDPERSQFHRSSHTKYSNDEDLNHTMLKQEDLLKRRTGGILTRKINIQNADKERAGLNSLKKIKGDGNIRDANFTSLKRVPNRTRMFKELLVTGRFKEIEHEVEETHEEDEDYDIDEEDILEYQLFNSIDKWSRRVTGFLNLFSGVIVGMFVVNVMIILATNDSALYSISLYFSQMFTLFVNLCVVFSIAETLIRYDQYIRLRDHFHPDTVKFQGYYVISVITSTVFMICWALMLLLPFVVLEMAYKDVNDIKSQEKNLYQIVTLLVGAVFTLFFILTPFLKRDDYELDSYEIMYSDDDLYAPEPDAIEMTAFA